MVNQTEQLNARFGLPGIRFAAGHNGLVKAVVESARFNAEVYLQGAHVSKWRPAGKDEVLWVSESSWFESGKPIRGGVPICFPWFANHPSDSSMPAHGTARISVWDLVTTETLASDAIAVTFETIIDQMLLRYRIEFSDSLRMQLTVTLAASAQQAATFEEALHTYFSVSDVRQIEIAGLEGASFIDKTDSAQLKSATDQSIRFSGETDRVYLSTVSACELIDTGANRRILVEKSGSQSTIVWNPWTAKAARMPDFEDDEWPGMVCIESANVASNAITLSPGESHEITVTIRCLSRS